MREKRYWSRTQFEIGEARYIRIYERLVDKTELAHNIANSHWFFKHFKGAVINYLTNKTIMNYERFMVSFDVIENPDTLDHLSKVYNMIECYSTHEETKWVYIYE